VSSGLHCEADENCAILCYDVASSGNLLLTFQNNLLVSSTGVKNAKGLHPERFFWILDLWRWGRKVIPKRR